MRPSVGSISLKMSLPVVVFPLPLSPANPKTSPRLISKLIPSTARTYSFLRKRMLSQKLFVTGKYFFKFSTLTNGSGI